MKQKIYKVRCIVMKTITRGINKGRPEDVYRMDEKIIIGNIDRAREIYLKEKNQANQYFQYANHFGMVELFEPHIFDNGELAYWPDNDKYIEQYRREVWNEW